MGKLMFTTVYDDVLSKIETMTRKNFDNDEFRISKGIRVKRTIVDNKYGYVDIYLENQRMLQEYKQQLSRMGRTTPLSLEEKQIFVNQVLVQSILFTAQDIMIYRILLSHYINYQQDGIATITLDMIHNQYRRKTFVYKAGADRFDKDTLKAYINVFRKLTSLDITMRFGESKLKSFKYLKEKDKRFFKHKLLTFHNEVTADNISKIEIKYSLGDFGTYICTSKQYGQFLPSTLYQLRFNRIDTFNMAVYIGRMIVINRRKRNEITIHVSTLLSRINKYNMKGYSISLTYLEYLTQLDPIKRNKKIKHIQEQLNRILTTLAEENRIKKYEYIGKFTYKFIKQEELAIKLYFNKHR